MSHAALAMGLRRQNVAEKAMTTLLTTMQNVAHKVRTTFGESAIACGGQKLKRPNQGVPQGNGIGPPGWSLVSTPCLDLLRKHGFGAKMQLPVSQK